MRNHLLLYETRENIVMGNEIEIDFILKLIESVERRKCLYDKKHPLYFHRNIREREWNEVGEICNRSGADCKHRWKLLRERYCKVMKKIGDASGSGYNVDEWRFLQPMMFLKGFLGPRRNRDNAKEQDKDTSYAQSMFSGDSLLEPLMLSNTPTPQRKSKPFPDSPCQKFDESKKSMEKSLAEPLQQDSTDEAFMRIVLCLMKELPENTKDEFQAGVMQELYRLRRSCRNVNTSSIRQRYKRNYNQ